MSDYLGNLLARSFAPMTAVRPELPSFFEPVKTNVDLATPFQVEISSETSMPPLDFETVAAPSTSPFARVKARVAKRASLLTEAMAGNCLPVASVEAPEKATRKKETDVDSVADAKSRMSVSPVDSDAGRPQSGTSVARIEIKAMSSLCEETPPRQVIPSATGPPPTPLSRAAPLTKREMETQGEVASRSAPTKMGYPKRDEVVKPVQPVRPHSEPVRPTAPLVRDLSAKPTPLATTPAPAIQVTIGRLEVRAVPASKAPRVQSVAAKTLSLDDYLRQRGSGGRR